MFCTDSYCLVGREVPDKHIPGIQDALGVPVHKITIAGTSLIGVFATGTDKLLLLPDILFDHEKEALDALNISYTIFSTDNTALGNNIIFNEKGCLVHPDYTKEEREQLRELIGIEPHVKRIAGIETPGSVIVFNNEFGLVHNDATDEEIAFVSELFGRECTNATVNLGIPYIRSGLCCNAHGFVISEASSGPEIAFVDEFLGYIRKE